MFLDAFGMIQQIVLAIESNHDNISDKCNNVVSSVNINFVGVVKLKIIKQFFELSSIANIEIKEVNNR